MDLAHRIRFTFAAAIAIVGVCAIALADGVTAGDGGELLPDLETLPPLESTWLALDQPKTGKSVLRLSNRIGNDGEGPLELRAETATNPCDPGEHEDWPDMDAVQRVYIDGSPGDGVFDPTEDLSANEYRVGCFEYHPQHDHWHFQDFAQYSLTDVQTGEMLAGPSKKIGFCIVDGDRAFPQLPGSPPGGVYPNGESGCGFGDPDGGPGTMGLSVGYADTYNSFLPGQRLNVTGVKRGVYCLVSQANPKHPDTDPSQLLESDAENNDRRVRIHLNPAAGKVTDLERRCPAA